MATQPTPAVDTADPVDVERLQRKLAALFADAPDDEEF